MKIVRKPQLPKCDFCSDDALYDAPTANKGPWANMCPADFQEHADESAEEVGYQFQLHTPAEPKPATDVLPIGVELNTLEEVIMDSERNIACPSCETSHSVEPDADYELSCEGCGLRFQIPEGVF